eukprot:TRINITY_DN61604_c0_g1_i1.p1 TRINITY_DN61604_c0_g1~~TRINITY_DN61604_c0_g1_i1.p1  ORF type:complete len:217 (+),score=31.54 TRINITY_DN61604_c0_g1_i1:51-653(+)
MTVFIDNTERSPTFRLSPLDTVKASSRNCLLQVWTDAPDAPSAWKKLLGRPFKGLRHDFYHEVFEKTIDDPYLAKAARSSLANASDEQQYLYDFSFSEQTIAKRGPHLEDTSSSSAEAIGELGVACLIGDEVKTLANESSSARKFCDAFHKHYKKGARIALILITSEKASTIQKIIKTIPEIGRAVQQECRDRSRMPSSA